MDGWYVDGCDAKVLTGVGDGAIAGEERLPYKEGFKRPSATITNDEIVDMAQKVAAAKPCC